MYTIKLRHQINFLLHELYALAAAGENGKSLTTTRGRSNKSGVTAAREIYGFCFDTMSHQRRGKYGKKKKKNRRRAKFRKIFKKLQN